jgi:hypothetical protein
MGAPPARAPLSEKGQEQLTFREKEGQERKNQIDKVIGLSEILEKEEAGDQKHDGRNGMEYARARDGAGI